MLTNAGSNTYASNSSKHGRDDNTVTHTNTRHKRETWITLLGLNTLTHRLDTVPRPKHAGKPPTHHFTYSIWNDEKKFVYVYHRLLAVLHFHLHNITFTSNLGSIFIVTAMFFKHSISQDIPRSSPHMPFKWALSVGGLKDMQYSQSLRLRPSPALRDKPGSESSRGG